MTKKKIQEYTIPKDTKSWQTKEEVAVSYGLPIASVRGIFLNASAATSLDIIKSDSGGTQRISTKSRHFQLCIARALKRWGKPPLKDPPPLIELYKNPRGTKPIRPHQVRNESPNENDLSLEGYESMTIGEIHRKYGDHKAFADVLKLRKNISEVDLNKIKLGVMRGQLVSRDLVAKYVFGMVETAFARFLDMPVSLSLRLQGVKDSAEIEEILRTEISKVLSSLKKDTLTAMYRVVADSHQADIDKEGGEPDSHQVN